MIEAKNLSNIIETTIGQVIREKLTGYNSALDPIIHAAVAAQAVQLQRLVTDSITESLANEQFRDNMKEQISHTLAKQLLAKFGGVLEQTVNQLKSDPATRARITLAIDEVVKGMVK